MATHYLHQGLAENLTRLLDSYQRLDWDELVSTDGPTLGEHWFIMCIYDWLSTGQVSKQLMGMVHQLASVEQVHRYHEVQGHTSAETVEWGVEEFTTEPTNIYQDISLGLLDLIHMNRVLDRSGSTGSQVVLSLCIECSRVQASMTSGPACFCSSACKTNASPKTRVESKSKKPKFKYVSRWKGLKYWEKDKDGNDRVIESSGRVKDSQWQLFTFSRKLARALTNNAGVDFMERVSGTNPPTNLTGRGRSFDLDFVGVVQSVGGSPELFGIMDIDDGFTPDMALPMKEHYAVSYSDEVRKIEAAIDAIVSNSPKALFNEETQYLRDKLDELTQGSHPLITGVIGVERKRYFTAPSADPWVRYEVQIDEKDQVRLISKPKGKNAKKRIDYIKLADIREESKKLSDDSMIPKTFDVTDSYPVPVFSIDHELYGHLQTPENLENFKESLMEMNQDDFLKYARYKIKHVPREMQDDMTSRTMQKLNKELMEEIQRAMQRASRSHLEPIPEIEWKDRKTIKRKIKAKQKKRYQEK